MDKKNLLGASLADLEELMLELGEKQYKGRQLYKWFYYLLESDFEQMTDLSRKLRKKLAENYVFRGLEAADIAVSSDGTEKFLFRLDDGKLIESVLIPEGASRTVCISSQAGCALKCAFCATGLMGFGRDLSAGEIVGQLLFLRKRYGEDAFRNIVFMGMGEPLLNYGNLIKSIEIITSDPGLSVSAKKVTVSTVGISPQIYALSDSGLKVNLAISLHAADDNKRQKIMPVARKYELGKLMKAAAYFARESRKKITFEYILFKGFNDSRQDADALARLTKGIPCKINILAYNPIGNLPYKRPSEEEVNEFGKYLYPIVPTVTIRKSRGLDISAACGQLAGKSQHFEEEENQ